MSLLYERGKEGRGVAGRAGKLTHSLRQICLILLISAAILIPTLTPIHKVAADDQVEILYVLLMNEKPVHSIDVFVCQDFEFEFLIDLPKGYEMVGFNAFIEWNPEQVELKGYKLAEWKNGEVVGELDEKEGRLSITGGGPAIFKEEWALLIFHCLGPGRDKIVALAPEERGVYLNGGETPVWPRPWDVYVTQSTQRPVGGEVYSTDKLAVLAPYIALVCLASMAVLAVKRRRR